VFHVKAGTVIRTFSLKDGRWVILRTPKWEDLDDLLEMINSLVDEKADIVRAERVSRGDEIDWLASVLRRVEKDEVFFLLAEIGAKVVGSSEIGRSRGGYDSHVGGIGIAIRNGFRDAGLGTEMMKTLIAQGQSIGLKVLTLSAFATNKRAIHVYEKLGFVKTGMVPRKFFREGQYIDEVVMTLVLGEQR
jgi:RimJ/RimL family protein N-acetyltransferase